MIPGIFLVIFAYLLGSIPTGLLLSLYIYRRDIRKEGSGNIGATNVFRVIGPLPGFLTLLGDALKGAIPVYISVRFYPDFQFNQQAALWVVLTALAAIIGHSASIFLGFQGGKSVATAAGALLVIFPKIVLILLVVFIAVLAATRYVSLASLTIATLFPFLVYISHPSNYVFLGFALFASLLVIFRHRSNIKRLIQGKENKLEWKRKKV